jgi:hypothetical protein
MLIDQYPGAQLGQEPQVLQPHATKIKDLIRGIG